MNKFTALADPNRRKILEILLEYGNLPSTEISKNFKTTPQAISQHLKILKETDLVLVLTVGPLRVYRLNQAGLLEVERWIYKFTKRWKGLSKLALLPKNI